MGIGEGGERVKELGGGRGTGERRWKGRQIRRKMKRMWKGSGWERITLRKKGSRNYKRRREENKDKNRGKGRGQWKKKQGKTNSRQNEAKNK